MSLHDEVREFLSGLLQNKGADVDLGDDTSLVLSGLLDSVDTIEIVTFLESRYGLDFGDIGFDQDRFDNIASIIKLVEEGGKSPSAERD
jgi:acyl carrier protein